MRFKVGDKVRCISGIGSAREGAIYTVAKVDSSLSINFILVEGISSTMFNDSFFELYEASPHPLNVGAIYGILYDRIKDTDEDLWIVAETIAEALGEVEDKL